MEWLWRLDQSVQEAVNHGWRSPAFDWVFVVLTYVGVGSLQAIFIAALIVPRRLRTCGLTCLTAWAAAGAINLLAKAILPRARPSNLLETILAPDERVFATSFPSGHAATSFAIALSLLLCWPGRSRPLVGALALLTALGVGLSRVYRGVHWPTDVLGGMALGCAAALAAHALISSRESRPALEETRA